MQDQIYNSFGASEPSVPLLRCRNATQTAVVLEWDPIELATADLISLSLYRNGQKAGNIPRPLQMHSTKISGLAVDTEYTFHLVLRTTAGTFASEKVIIRTHKMTDLSGITITTGILPGSTREKLTEAVARIGAKLVDGVRIDTTHFVTTEGRGQAWEKAVETNIPVVRPEWVDACEKSGRILGVTKFYLDAMRPGPLSEETKSITPPSAPAEPPAQPTPTPSAAQEPKVEEKPLPDSPNDDEDEKGDSDDDEESEEVEQKAQASVEPKSIAAQDRGEQKVRLEDKDEHSVALRPATNGQDKGDKAEADEESGDDDEDEKEENGDEKPSPNQDGSSFQDVAL